MFISTNLYMLEIISDVKHARSTQLASNRLIKFANNMLSVDGRHVNQKVMEMPHMRRNLIFAVIAYDQVEVKTEQTISTRHCMCVAGGSCRDREEQVVNVFTL